MQHDHLAAKHEGWFHPKCQRRGKPNTVKSNSVRFRGFFKVFGAFGYLWWKFEYLALVSINFRHLSV